MVHQKKFFRRPEFLLVALWFVLSLPWHLGFKSIPFDSVQAYYPSVAFVVQQLQRMEPPWWNPHVFGGYPHFTDPQGMTFQPSVILPMMLSELPSYSWYGSVILLHVLLAGLAAFRLGRDYGLGMMACWLFAITVMYGGVAASRLQHSPMIVSYAWFLWLWVLLRRLRLRPRHGLALGCGVTGGLAALQMTQVTYLGGIAAVIYSMVLLAGRPGESRGPFLRNLLLAACVAGVVCAPQWLATLTFLPYTVRAELPLEAAEVGSLHWDTFLTLFAGGVLNNGGGEFWGRGDLSQDYLYLGAVPLTVWLLWGGATAFQHRALVRGLTIGVVASVVYALGLHTPVYGVLYDVLPGLQLFRRPADALFLFVPFAALLAAVALQVREDGSRIRAPWPAIVVLAAITAYAVISADLGRAPSETPWRLVIPLAIAAGAVYLLRPGRSLARESLVAVIALMIVDVTWHNLSARFYGGGTTAHMLHDKPPLLRASRRTEVEVASYLTSMVTKGAVPYRVEFYDMGVLVNGAAVHGISMSSGYNPWLYQPYQVVFGASTLPPPAPDRRSFTAWTPDFSAASLDLLGTRTIVAGAGFPGARLREGAYFLERETVLPRVLNPRRVRTHSGALPPARKFRATAFEREAWMPAEDLREVECPLRGAGKLLVSGVRYSANRVDLEYRAERPGWLVLNEIIAPGWTAQLDSQPWVLLRANGLFRASCVPAGEHTLSFVYRPGALFHARWSGRGEPFLGVGFWSD